jgi:Cation transport ATPase
LSRFRFKELSAILCFAGTVVEEGEITIRVKEVEGNNRFDQIVTMIEESEKLKSELEGKG